MSYKLQRIFCRHQSDVSTILPAFATDAHRTDDIRVHHLSGSTVFDTLGTVTFSSSALPVRALIVSPDQLPPGLVGILGIEEIRTLQASLDCVTANPRCALTAAILLRCPEQPIDTESEPLCPVDPPAQPPAFVLSVFLAFLLLLASAVQLGVGHRHRDLSGQALLPGTPSSGHSLFDQPPRATSSGRCWGAAPRT